MLSWLKALKEMHGFFIYHFESLEKVKAIGEKMRSSKVFDELTPLIVPGSVNVTMYNQVKTW